MTLLKTTHFLSAAALLVQLTASIATAERGGSSCVELFATPKGLHELLVNKILPSYHPYTETVDYLTLLMAKGVTVEFYRPKYDEDARQYSHLFVEPNINSQWRHGQFNPKDTRIFLPKNASDINSGDGHYQLLTQLARMHRIFELQELGALFDRDSILFNNPVILTGFQENMPLTNMTLAALQHAFLHFGVKKVSFISLNSDWSNYAIPPQLSIAQSMHNPSQLYIRAYYLERTDYWIALAGQLEELMFAPNGKPFFRSYDTKTH